jgi:hypothetical protein
VWKNHCYPARNDYAAVGVEGTYRLEDTYVDGVSLTHGPAGSRQHIWTFVAVLYETGPDYASRLGSVCPCTESNTHWPHQIPSFIGNSYFCDSGNPGPDFSNSTTYLDDPLWDGEGCGTCSTCCQLNNPPWFCMTLPQPTMDDLEVRICGDQEISNEDTNIELMDIYVQ